MKTGATISGGAHLALLVIAFFGVDWFTDRDDKPLNVTEIELVDGTDFDALISSAPTVPSDRPSELSKPGDGDPSPDQPETPHDKAESTDAPILTDAPEPEVRPERPEIAYKTPTDVPTEAPKPSIAEIPSPDPLDRESAEPESPPSTEPVAPLAALDAPKPDARPTRPPEPEPEPEEKEPEKTEVTAASEEAENERTPDPDPKNETDPESVAETSPEAPEGPAPREARLPLAKPADLAAAAEAARKAEVERTAREKAENEPERTAAKPEPEETDTPAKPERTAASNTRRGPPLNTREKNALRVGIKKYYNYTGDRSDPTVQVKVVVNLTEAGEIVGKPEIVKASTGTERALARAGARALVQAANAGEFKRLPPDKYDRWKRLNVIFTIDEPAVSG